MSATVRDLHSMLERAMEANPAAGDMPAVVHLHNSGAIGPVATAGIVSVGPGIDWDSGKFFLNLDTPVMEYRKKPKNNGVVTMQEAAE